MKKDKINTVSAVGLAGLLLALPSLATAEDYYRKTLGYRVEPETDPPSYVHNLSKTQFEQFRDVEWLDVGLEHRTRYEYRENDLRPTPTGTNSSTTFRPDPDNLFLLRTRAYLGVHDILDPLRFAVEFQRDDGIVAVATVLHDLRGVKPAGAEYVKACGFAGVRSADFAFRGHHVTPEDFSTGNRSRRACHQNESGRE